VLPSAKIGALALWDSWCGRLVRFRRSHTILKIKEERKMKDGIVLHPEYGVNPSIEICIVCGEEMGIALLGNGIKGQAPHHICTGGVCDNCKKIIDEGGCFIIEVEDGSDQKNPYRTGRYCAIKKEAAKKMFGQEHNIVYMEESAYNLIIL
jgi:hypothetical protein